MSRDEPKPLLLLVEDDKLTRTVLREYLMQSGFNVDMAANGEVALEKLARRFARAIRQYQLVLTDVYMPKVNGESLVKEIVTSDCYGHIPVAVMSSNDAREDILRMLSMGAAEYLVKPLSRAKVAGLRRLMASPAPPHANAEAKVGHATCRQQSKRLTSLLQVASLLTRDSGGQAAELTSGSDASHASRMLDPSGSTDHSGDSIPSASAVPSTRVQDPPRALCNASACSGSGGTAETALVPASVQAQVVTATPLAATQQQGCWVTSSAVMPPISPLYLQPMDVERLLMATAAGSIQEAVAVPRSMYLVQAPVHCMQSARSASTSAARKAALERFRAKKAKRLNAPKVRYVARKKLAEARPRYKGQFIKADALPPGASWDPPKQVVESL